ncbi:MAG: gamma-glutamyl-gamma-aminobutyrate hydrolase family protein [Ardenticatenia bacterium]|nr:gamma-glutamyl-gamma-aminobutyrate hydrolase family protein [Ardenticatenia bacterium]
MERTPTVGITVKTWPRRGRRRWPHYAVPTAYAEAVERAGGVPFLLPNAPQMASAFIARVDGLLLSGGGDVHPKRYTDAPRHPAVYGVDPCRDALELKLVHLALERQMPVLAICRGIQVLNVALGGHTHSGHREYCGPCLGPLDP